MMRWTGVLHGCDNREIPSHMYSGTPNGRKDHMGELISQYDGVDIFLMNYLVVCSAEDNPVVFCKRVRYSLW
jgi:hypothetical protein